MPFVSNYAFHYEGNFYLQLLRRFKDIAVFCRMVFLLPHLVVSSNVHSNTCVIKQVIHKNSFKGDASLLYSSSILPPHSVPVKYPQALGFS